MVLANKWVLSNMPELPLLFLWLQLVMAILLMTVAHILNLVPLPSQASGTTPALVSSSAGLLGFARGAIDRLIRRLPTVQWEKCRKLSSLIAVNVIGLTGNTLCLKYVDASLYQVRAKKECII